MRDILNPEEVQSIMSLVSGTFAQVVVKHEGLMPPFVGNALAAVFGVRRNNEDDPIRAIRAAREINQRVAALDTPYRHRTGRALTMQAGIETGRVAWEACEASGGIEHLGGPAFDTAARLSQLSAGGEVLVGPDTFLYAQGWFVFEVLPADKRHDQGDSAPVYRVVGSRERPRKVYRPFGLRARLIGRQRELERLGNAARQVVAGEGSVAVITGAAGTGKSRLIEEFKAGIDQDTFQWFEGHAYPSARNIPYAPLIDLLGSACGIEEGDDPAAVRHKIDTRLGALLGEEAASRPLVGSLFDLQYDELANTSPEAWKQKLQQAVLRILDRLARIKPTIICIEDLHWADPSFVALVRHIISSEYMPVVFVCSYRPTFSLIDKTRAASRPERLIEIELHDLPPHSAIEMLVSLLGTTAVPEKLRQHVHARVEGNPFYLEEMVNALIERQTLTRAQDRWQITGPLRQSDMSATIHGVVAGRLDYLEKPTRRLLQEAAVIGRVFPYAILKQIAAGRAHLDQSLHVLEHLDMIRPQEDPRERKYAFKHALLQEVVYRGIRKDDRRSIHENIARKIEKIFADRLRPYYETLAYHFTMGHSADKAIDYLVKSGAKSMRRHAVEEAHHHFQQAYELLCNLNGDPRRRAGLLVDVLIKWFFVFNVRGIFNAMITLLQKHEKEALAIGDPSRLGMYYCCLGWALQRRERLLASYDCLLKAERLAEAAGDERVGAYAAACRIWTCTDLGRLDEAVAYGLKARRRLADLKPDQELIRINLTGLAIAYWFRGESGKCREVGEALLAYGDNGADIRSTSDGYLACGMGRFVAGDYDGAIDCCHKAIGASVGLVHSLNSKFLLGYAYLSKGQIEAAAKVLNEIIRFASRAGYEYLGTAAEALDGMIALAQGRLNEGLTVIKAQMQRFQAEGKRYHHLTFEYLLGRIYLQLALREGDLGFLTVCRNFGFLWRHAPRAAGRAEKYFRTTITLAGEIGARGIQGQAHYDLGRLQAHRKRLVSARRHLNRSAELFQACGADQLLAQARRQLQSLPGRSNG
jgi:class 3 adenylate cyclase/tetratricopeptide (TPR) repeat protein